MSNDSQRLSAGVEGRFLIAYRLSVDFIKAVLWPFVTMFVFLSLRAPLLALLSQLPDLLSNTTHIALGGVTLDRRLKDAAVSPEVRDAVGRLSPGALLLLLDAGRTGWKYLSRDWEQNDSDASEIRELTQNGLVIVSDTRQGEAYPVRYSLTDAGKHAYEIVSQALVAQLLATPGATPAAKRR